MVISELRALAKHLKTRLSSSLLPPPLPFFSPFLTLRRGPSQTLSSFPLPGRSLSPDPASLLLRPHCPSLRFPGFPRPLAGDRFSRSFASTPSDPEVAPQEDRQSPAPCFGGEDEREDHLAQVQQDQQSRFIPVKAYFLCTSIDLKSLQAQNAFNVVVPPTSRATNYVVLRYYDVKNDPQFMKTGFPSESTCHYMVVFRYGSVVLFNVSDHEADGYLKIVEKHASGLVPEMRKDDYAVAEKPTLDTWMQGGLDHIVLKTLNIDGIRIIASVLSQSIALDYHIQQADAMVGEFRDINRLLQKTGTFAMKPKKLFQLAGSGNSKLADVILELGLFERSDIAWKNANYAQIWEYLRDEYELTQRFGDLDFKLRFVEHNINLFQEILQNRTFVFLEWLIILLIAVDILLSFRFTSKTNDSASKTKDSESQNTSEEGSAMVDG
ncbi:hypothetical protein Cni_G10648 [Canna indica]|uniref:DUF155 domain-containing protein n=1 Tax=Canna indica TaxID=4628 RepID=A0AAQ3K4N4_9LILI|nr:hypothetical protein Cni_G10648 [Canna indica]